MAQGKISRSDVALRLQFILTILKNLSAYQLSMEELEKYRVALMTKLKKAEKRRKIGLHRGLRIAIQQIFEAIKKAEN